MPQCQGRSLRFYDSLPERFRDLTSSGLPVAELFQNGSGFHAHRDPQCASLSRASRIDAEISSICARSGRSWITHYSEIERRRDATCFDAGVRDPRENEGSNPSAVRTARHSHLSSRESLVQNEAMTTPDTESSNPEESRIPRFAELDAEITAANARSPKRRGKRPRKRQPAAPPGSPLRNHVEHFVIETKEKFSKQAKRSPRTFRARVIATVKAVFGPQPKPPGAPRKTAITMASELFQEQRKEIGEGTRERVNWVSIARVVYPKLWKRPAAARRVAMDRLRNAVYKRKLLAGRSGIEGRHLPPPSAQSKRPSVYKNVTVNNLLYS